MTARWPALRRARWRWPARDARVWFARVFERVFERMFEPALAFSNVASHLLAFVVSLVVLPALTPTATWAQDSSGERALPDMAGAVSREESVVVSITTTRQVQATPLGFDPDAALPSPNRPGAARPRSQAPRMEQDREIASGFVIGRDGEIITNAHVVAGAEDAKIRLQDGRVFRGRVVGLDKLTDVALVKIEAHDLPVASIGNSASLTSGEWVVAIGSPFGLDSSITAGVVSATSRILPGETVGLIQTDVAINPGSSGGPLFNLRGEVVGINSMVFSLTGGYMGVSFAVPIDVAMKIVNELRTAGRVSRGQIGAKIQPLTPELARSFGFPTTAGALVTRVARGSPAERGGLRGGDVLAGVGERTDASFEQLQQAVGAARPGQVLTLNVWRGNAIRRLPLTVEEAPADLPLRAAQASPAPDARFGLNLGELSAARREDLGVESGVPVLESHGAAWRAGIQSDDVIVAVGDRPVRSIAEFDLAISAAPAGRPIALLILRGASMSYMAIERPDGAH
ncbi:DegQ family serine endoprotease [soil metagenome]